MIRRILLARRQSLAVIVLPVALLLTVGWSPTTSVEGVAAFANHAIGRYLQIDLGVSAETEGRMFFVDDADGLFWPKDPVELVTEVDGSITVSYTGAGYSSPDADFDPVSWVIGIGPTVNEVTDMEISGSLSADRTEAEVTLVADLDTYLLEDESDATGAAVAVQAIVDDMDAGEWAGVYGSFHPELAVRQSENAFVEGMEESIALQGSIVSVSIEGSIDVADNGGGWDVAHADLDVTMLKDGCEAIYPTTIDLVHDGGWLVGGIGSIDADVEAPVSSITSIAETYSSSTSEIEVPFASSDDATGICRVELWWRHGSWTGSGELGEWVLGPTSATSPITFVPESGPGAYEFYTIATDGAANVELPPEDDPDAATTVLAPVLTPSYPSTVLADGPTLYWRLSETEGATAVDAAGSFDGAYHGTVGFEAGTYSMCGEEQSIWLDGTSTYITGSTDAAFALASTGRKTFEFWVYPVDTTERETIFHRGSAAAGYDYSIYWEDGEIGATVSTSAGIERIHATSGSNTVPTEGLRHIVVTLDDTTDEVEFFVDGISTAATTTAWTGSSTSQDTDPIVIGRNDETGDDYFSGGLDEVAIYDHILSPLQVAAHYQGSRYGSCTMYSQYLGADGPMSVWSLGESEGPVAYSWNTGFDGTYHGSVTFSEPALAGGLADQSIMLDGTSTYITGSTDAAFALASTGRKTFEFWVVPTDTAGPGVIFHRGSAAAGYDYSIYWEDGEIGATVFTAGGTERIHATSGADTVPAGELRHIVVTLDDTTDEVEFFVNGVSTAATTTAWSGSSTSQDTDPIVIGRNNETEDDYFSGGLDEVAIYDHILSPPQVGAHYQAGS